MAARVSHPSLACGGMGRHAAAAREGTRPKTSSKASRREEFSARKVEVVIRLRARGGAAPRSRLASGAHPAHTARWCRSSQPPLSPSPSSAPRSSPPTRKLLHRATWRRSSHTSAISKACAAATATSAPRATLGRTMRAVASVGSCSSRSGTVSSTAFGVKARAKARLPDLP